MAKKKFLIAMDEDLHKKLKKLAAEGECNLGEAIGMMLHHAVNRVDLARYKKELPYDVHRQYIMKRIEEGDTRTTKEYKDVALPERKSGLHDSIIYHMHEITLMDQAEIDRIEEKGNMPKKPRPFMTFGRDV